ncbi:hypothetical protein FACS1894156_5670 [Bacteroidia bacterium]|nr:hypothetical protein FACS1894156_5670 [Bacteroidia bacterium]
MYTTTARHAPLFEKRNEVNLEGGLSPNSVHAAGSWAVTNHIGVSAIGSLSYRNISDRLALSKGQFIEDGIFATTYHLGADNYRSGEVSLGLYNFLPPAKWNLEIFGGYGQGSDYNKDWRYYNSKFKIYFVQGDVWQRYKFMRYGTVLRLAYSQFNFAYSPEQNNWNKIDTPNPPNPQNFIHRKFHNIHLEPSIFIKFGVGHFNGVVQAGLSIPTTLTSLSDINLPYKIKNGDWNYTWFHISWGVNYKIF